MTENLYPTQALLPADARLIADAWVAAGLSQRVATVLGWEGIADGAALAGMSADALLRLPNFGRVSLREVQRWLVIHGYVISPGNPVAKPVLDNLTDEELIGELARRLKIRTEIIENQTND